MGLDSLKTIWQGERKMADLTKVAELLVDKLKLSIKKPDLKNPPILKNHILFDEAELMQCCVDELPSLPEGMRFKVSELASLKSEILKVCRINAQPKPANIPGTNFNLDDIVLGSNMKDGSLIPMTTDFVVLHSIDEKWVMFHMCKLYMVD